MPLVLCLVMVCNFTFCSRTPRLFCMSVRKKTNVSVKKNPVFCLSYEEAALVGVVGTQILRLREVNIESCRIEAP